MLCQAISTPIVKPVNGLCNLACSYCYAEEPVSRVNRNNMGLDTLRATIDFFCNDQDRIEFTWHGGEPLSIGLDFYQNVIKFQQPWVKKGKKITNFIQTNVTFVTPVWIDFFSQHNFFVGVSLDGPKRFHDKTRCYPNGNSSYDNVMNGITLLRQAGVFNGVICGISTVNYQFPKELFSFFIAEGIKKLKFARVKDIGYYKDIHSLVISPAQYTDFMISIFDLWLGLDDSAVEIRDIQSVVNLILGGSDRECIYSGGCNHFATVYSDGSIYGCDSFPRVEPLYFGSVFDDPDKIRQGLHLQKFQKLVDQRKSRCERCKWYFVCQGGCSKDCYENLDAVEPINEVCTNLKRYFEYIFVKLQSYNLV